MGQHLKQRYGEALYTIGVFAAGGEAVDSLGIDNIGGPSLILALAPRKVPANDRFEVEKRLAQLSAKDFFLDLRSAGAEWGVLPEADWKLMAQCRHLSPATLTAPSCSTR